jgi:hypothetical protein
MKFSKEQAAAWSKCYSKNTEPRGVPDPSYDPFHVKVLYSVDDLICTTVANLYSALGHRRDSWHPPGHNSWSGWFWEFRYATEFRKFGLVVPRHLRDHGFNPGIHWRGGWNGFSAAYKLKLADGLPPQIVWISDIPWHSEVSTNVVVLKAGRDFDDDFRLQPTQMGSVADDEAHEHSVELGVLFDGTTHKDAFKFYELPYLFRDGDTMAKYSDVDVKGRRSGQPIDLYIGGATNVVQRVYSFQGRIIFIAQEGDGWRIVVYRLNDGKTKQDICYLGTLVSDRK